MKLLDTPEARNELLDAIDRGEAYLPIVLDHEDAPWILFTNEDADLFVTSVPWEVTTAQTLTWAGLLAREREWRPMRLIYDGHGYASPGVDHA